jgi:hypothetical protein
MSMHSGMVVSSGPTPQAAHAAAQVLDQKKSLHTYITMKKNKIIKSLRII